MSAPLDAVPDHVAAAVPDFAAAETRWCEQLGGRRITDFDRGGVMRTLQLGYPNGAKLELIAPSELDTEETGFVPQYLARFGAGVHHITLKVPDLLAAVARVEDAGLDVVDVRTDMDLWHEGFLRPSQVGGVIIQLAWAGRSDEEWARRQGHEIEPNPAGAAELLGPTLAHDDLERATGIWSLLGATVEGDDVHRTCRWEGAPLTVELVAGTRPGPIGLRFAGTDALPATPEHGPRVLVP